jgi:hypothetical protein
MGSLLASSWMRKAGWWGINFAGWSKWWFWLCMGWSGREIHGVSLQGGVAMDSH